MKKRTSRPGVTLVEMLVVMAILMMLAGVLAIVWNGLDVQSKEKTLTNTLTILDNALTEYRDARGTFPVPNTNDVTEAARKDRNALMCRALLEEPQSRVIVDVLDDGPRGALRRVPPPLPTLVYDPWDRPLDYTYRTGDAFPLLRSFGPDPNNTSDDITNR